MTIIAVNETKYRFNSFRFRIFISIIINFLFLSFQSCQHNSNNFSEQLDLNTPNIDEKSNNTLTRLYDTVEIDTFTEEKSLIINNRKKVQDILTYITSIWQEKNKFMWVPINSEWTPGMSVQTHMPYYSFSFSQKEKTPNEYNSAYYMINETFGEDGNTLYIISDNNDDDYILTKDHIQQLRRITGFKFQYLK